MEINFKDQNTIELDKELSVLDKLAMSVFPIIETQTKKEPDFFTLKNPFTVIVNGHKMLVSKIEQQIAYKFHLGTEKDIEDAVYLYEIFKERLNTDILREYGNKLNVLTAMKREGVLHG